MVIFKNVELIIKCQRPGSVHTNCPNSDVVKVLVKCMKFESLAYRNISRRFKLTTIQWVYGLETKRFATMVFFNLYLFIGIKIEHVSPLGKQASNNVMVISKTFRQMSHIVTSMCPITIISFESTCINNKA